MKDLVILVADKNMEYSVKGILSRPQALSIRQITFDIFKLVITAITYKNWIIAVISQNQKPIVPENIVQQKHVNKFENLTQNEYPHPVNHVLLDH